MKHIIIAFFFASVSAIPGVLCFIALFFLGTFSNLVEILMYRGLLLAAIAALANLFLLSFMLRKRPKAEYLSIGAVSMGLAANVIFLVVFPVTIDRSVSIYLLGQLASHDSGMTVKELDERLVHIYVQEYRAVERSMREQVITGNVERSGERYILTSQGKRCMALSHFLTRTFHIDSKYVRPSGHVSDTPK